MERCLICVFLFRSGGINPILAHEMHRNNIVRVVDETLQASNILIEDVDAIAVTNRPGNNMNIHTLSNR